MYDYNTEEKCDRILTWIENSSNTTFDDSTFRGILDFYDKNERFTTFQETAINNIFENYKIEDWYNLRYDSLGYEIYDGTNKMPPYMDRDCGFR